MSENFWRYYPKNDMTESLYLFRKRPVKKYFDDAHAWTYYKGGDGENVIVFIHGMGGSYDIWWQQIMEFEKRYRVISISYPPIDNLKSLVKGIIQILNSEDVERCTAVGTSLGGYIVQYMAAYYPSYIQKAVLGNTFPPNDIYRKKNRWKVLFLSLLWDGAVRKIVRNMMLRDIRGEDESSQLLRGYIIEKFDTLLDKKTLLARYKCVVEKFETCKNECIPELYLIESENDPLIPLILRKKLREEYNFKMTHTFKDGGHFPYLHNAKEYNRVLEKFLNS